MESRTWWMLALFLLFDVFVLLVGGWFVLYHRVRDVRASTAIVCGPTTLEVRHVYEQEGHTPLSFGQTFVEIAPPGQPRPTPGGTRPNPMPGAWVEPSELPAHQATRPLASDERAWMVYAPDPAHYSCLIANLPALRTALGPGPDDATEVVVWAGAEKDVWPSFRTPDGIAVRVRRNGTIEAEFEKEQSLETHGIGLVYRDASGARHIATSERGRAAHGPGILDAAVDADGRTVAQRYPAATVEPRTDAEIDALRPQAALEHYPR